MTDIVERLRGIAIHRSLIDDKLLLHEAADEIEWLRVDNEQLMDLWTKDSLGKAVEKLARAEIERLRGENINLRERGLGWVAEIERLRAALESLTHDPPQSLAREPDTDCEVVLKMREIARRALEPKP